MHSSGCVLHLSSPQIVVRARVRVRFRFSSILFNDHRFGLHDLGYQSFIHFLRVTAAHWYGSRDRVFIFILSFVEGDSSHDSADDFSFISQPITNVNIDGGSQIGFDYGPGLLTCLRWILRYLLVCHQETVDTEQVEFWKGCRTSKWEYVQQPMCESTSEATSWGITVGEVAIDVHVVYRVAVEARIEVMNGELRERPEISALSAPFR